MRHLATIQRIEEVQPIEGADAIEKVRVKDWWCVAKKGECTPGMIVVYFEIDSLLPKVHPQFEFLSKGTKEKTMVIEGKTYTGYRLKTIKLRGQVSQGLVLPINAAPLYNALTAYEIGQDVSEEIGVVKYEAPIPAQLQGKIKGSFPGFLRKTDEERVQNMGDIIARHQGEHFYVTEKLDGTSATFYKKDGVFGVCSRNLDLLDTPGNTHWEIAKKFELPEKLPDGYAVQGEIIGSNIGTNPLGIQGHEFYAFNGYDIKEARYLGFNEFNEFCDTIGVHSVPVLNSFYTLEKDVAGLLAEFDGLKSRLAPELAEGVVIRPLIEQTEEINGSLQRFSFKVISNTYLLGEK